MSDRKTVLITGVTGRIGREIVPLLAAGGRYELRCGHRRPPAETPDVPNPVYCPIDDADAVRAAVEGVHTIVHLAANAGNAPLEEEMVPNNIVGPYNLLKAACAAGVRRVLFASTNHVVYNWFKLDHQPIGEEVPPRPDSYYGVTKAYGEVLGRYFVENEGLPSFFVLRIGWFLPAGSKHLRKHPAAIHMWLSPRDFVQLIERCIEAPEHLRYDVFNAISGNSRQMMLLDHAKAVLGYAPEDNSERYVSEYEGELPEWMVPRR